jgi:ubiquinone/menaquinone biosynthesis C-methylase UbiE
LAEIVGRHLPPSLPDPYVPIIVDRLLKYRGKGFCLEVGCGTGKCPLALSIPGATTVLLDISKEGVMLAKELYERSGAEGFFAVEDVAHLPFLGQRGRVLGMRGIVG